MLIDGKTNFPREKLAESQKPWDPELRRITFSAEEKMGFLTKGLREGRGSREKLCTGRGEIKQECTSPECSQRKELVQVLRIWYGAQETPQGSKFPLQPVRLAVASGEEAGL